ncbi:MAG: 2-dehydropantoate 2-reductase [Flavobacteriales bacterium]|nr:2-dehydropantoate 2-reductase [Flavobacteriia bacterium]NCP06994.1 2-dehydropantoate 2-reductase [Flavobacteriales bacterium]PIV94592.1 MAG: 2-dehydropantoate 2-reductase [Flavobacteriaceae bacterium CG17_big_fil_post_rev_8_21_14_2_50_33_15]PIY13436.1 MAG: 2-dehydropantoate 2-reductase [Flavobacteriaceae bacterium CG_4_10_14_3_um_filter_33_47]PJB18725.1 MAG: 2-dehydropantoate 2-reductase [Flavobacteriaceae bacterium CG_4_9_14_3_um_filter_33_16]
MNIVVIGAGGVGGYFGGKLANAGFQVTFVARGEHLKTIKNKGLQVKSVLGDFTVQPKVTENISDIKNPDLVILGVKSWQVTEVAKALKAVINENTMVLPLQNGADNADKLVSVLPKKNVLAGLCKIVSKVESPGVIHHMTFEPEIVFGEYDNRKTERVKQLKEVFDVAGFKNTLSDDIHLDVWKKFLFIGTISGIGSITRAVFGVMRAQEGIRKIIYDTANEMVAVANAKGIALTSKDVDMIVKVIDNLDYNTTASMQRDMMEDKPSELENFNGYIVNQGKMLGVKTPTNAFIYHCLLPQELKARQ